MMGGLGRYCLEYLEI